MKALLVVLFVTAALAAATGAAAQRPPSSSEAAKIRAAMLHELELPARCLQLRIRVSTVDSSFALAAPLWARMTGSCAKYAADGVDIVRKRFGVWRFRAAGSDWSRCTRLVPRRVVHDLTGTWCQ